MHYYQNPDVFAADLDGEVCLFLPDRAEYVNLNVTGSAIWNLLVDALETDQIVEKLQECYEVDEEICRTETEAFLARALELGMLTSESGT